MDFKTYQEAASKTIQDYAHDSKDNKIVPFLGLMGEAGSVITELKKRLSHGDEYSHLQPRLKEELGDVLWYLAAIATNHDLSLEEIAKENLSKTANRFMEVEPEEDIRYDRGFPIEEQFPDEFEVEFQSLEIDNKKVVRLIRSDTGKQLGDDITDNAHEEDGYRFHDVFHFGYVAHLGWSPVVRKFLGNKRKSDPKIDEVEDGARAAITEEFVSLYIFNQANQYNLHKYSDRIDSEVLKTVQGVVEGFEVQSRTLKQWEAAILESYKAFHDLEKNDGGRVLVSLKNRKLTYLGKK